MKRKMFINYFKHVPDDLVISSMPGMVISAVGTLLLVVLFVLEFGAYLEVRTETTLVVDEIVDETLRMNFNVTLHEVPCEYLSVDVSDMTGFSTHNITKDILKWRLDSRQRLIKNAAASSAGETKDATRAAKAAEEAAAIVDAAVFPDDEPEPEDTNLSEHLTADTFEPFLKQHELTLVNYYAPWCIWCRRLEPVYLEAASKVPTLHFHGHARMAQVDCVANQDFCLKNHIRAYPTLRMYKDGDPVNFELFTGQRVVDDLLKFIQQQMLLYKKSHSVARKQEASKFSSRRGALVEGNDLYRAKMGVTEAREYCGNNEECSGFTWANAGADKGDEPMVFFKSYRPGSRQEGQVNKDEKWSSFVKLANGTAPISTSGSLKHGPEGCQIAGHLQVRKVPGTLRLYLHSPEHDHANDTINSSHIVNEFWFGEPLTDYQMSRLPASDQEELASPTSHLLEGLTFPALSAGHSHVHYLKVVTRMIKHVRSKFDTVVYKYTVHSNKFESADLHAPAVDFKYDLSPISIIASQKSMPTYHFLTSTCAIIGGVFTVIGLLENILHHTSEAMRKKVA